MPFPKLPNVYTFKKAPKLPNIVWLLWLAALNLDSSLKDGLNSRNTTLIYILLSKIGYLTASSYFLFNQKKVTIIILTGMAFVSDELPLTKAKNPFNVI